jgi:hypothetical protein
MNLVIAIINNSVDTNNFDMSLYIILTVDSNLKNQIRRWKLLRYKSNQEVINFFTTDGNLINIDFQIIVVDRN